MKEKSYAGRITNSGSQRVDALFTTPRGKQAIAKRGDDLRAGFTKKTNSVKGGKQ